MTTKTLPKRGTPEYNAMIEASVARTMAWLDRRNANIRAANLIVARNMAAGKYSR